MDTGKKIASLKFDNDLYHFLLKRKKRNIFLFKYIFYGEKGEFNHHRNFRNTHFFSARFVMYYKSP